MPLPLVLPSFATNAVNTVLSSIPADFKDIVKDAVTSLTPFSPTSVVSPRSGTDNAVFIPPCLPSITRAIYLFMRSEFHHDGGALHDFATIHFDADHFDHASMERAFLPDYLSAEQDFEDAKACLAGARQEMHASAGGIKGGDDGLMRHEFGVVLREIEGRERDRRDLKMISDAGLITVKERIWIEKMADGTDLLVMEGDQLSEEMARQERERGRQHSRR